MTNNTAPWGATRATALLVLADGTVIEGRGREESRVVALRV